MYQRLFSLRNPLCLTLAPKLSNSNHQGTLCAYAAARQPTYKNYLSFPDRRTYYHQAQQNSIGTIPRMKGEIRSMRVDVTQNKIIKCTWSHLPLNSRPTVPSCQGEKHRLQKEGNERFELTIRGIKDLDDERDEILDKEAELRERQRIIEAAGKNSQSLSSRVNSFDQLAPSHLRVQREEAGGGVELQLAALTKRIPDGNSQ